MAFTTSQHRYDKTEIRGSALVIQGDIQIATAYFACPHEAAASPHVPLLGAKRGWDESSGDGEAQRTCRPKRRRVGEVYEQNALPQHGSPQRSWSFVPVSKRSREQDFEQHDYEPRKACWSEDGNRDRSSEQGSNLREPAAAIVSASASGQVHNNHNDLIRNAIALFRNNLQAHSVPRSVCNALGLE